MKFLEQVGKFFYKNKQEKIKEITSIDELIKYNHILIKNELEPQIESLKIDFSNDSKFIKDKKETIFSLNEIEHLETLKDIEINEFAFQDVLSKEDKLKFINILINLVKAVPLRIINNSVGEYKLKIKYYRAIKEQIEDKGQYPYQNTSKIEEIIEEKIKNYIEYKNENFLTERNTILLEEVNQVIYSNFQEVRGNSFKKLKNLESLTLTNGNLQSLIGFENLKKVRKLNLSNNKLVSLENLKNLPELEELDISHNYLDDNLDNKSVYEILKTLPKLKKLTISAKKDDFADIILNGEDRSIHTKNIINLNKLGEELRKKIQTMLPNCKVECKIFSAGYKTEYHR